MDRPDFTQSLETQEIVRLLADDKHAALFTYDEICKSSGANDKDDVRASISSARRILQRDKGIVFVTIIGEGIRRATDAEIVDSTARDVSGIRRTSRRGIERLSKVRDLSGLPRDKKTQFNLATSSLALIHHVTTPSAQAKIESKVEKQNEKLPVAETLAALGIA